MNILFFNPDVTQLVDYPSPNHDYGIDHSIYSSVASSSVEPDGVYCTRNTCNPNMIQSPVNWPSAGQNDYAVMFFFSWMLFNVVSCENGYRKAVYILVNLMGAWDTGDTFNGDHCFVCEIKALGVYLEFYVSPKGKITEIRGLCSDHSIVYYPLNAVWVFTLLYANLAKVKPDFVHVNDQLRDSCKTIALLFIASSRGLNDCSRYGRFDHLMTQEGRKTFVQFIELYYSGLTSVVQDIVAEEANKTKKIVNTESTQYSSNTNEDYSFDYDLFKYKYNDKAKVISYILIFLCIIFLFSGCWTALIIGIILYLILAFFFDLKD